MLAQFDWTYLEQINDEENKDTTVSFQSTDKQSMIRCIGLYIPSFLKPFVAT